MEPFFSLEWQNDWINPNSEAIERRRVHLRSCSRPQLRRFHSIFIDLVIRSWRDIFNPTYLIPFVDELGYTHVDVASTMADLLNTAGEALSGKDEIALRAYFEALCTFDTVLQLEWLDHRDPYATVKNDVHRCYKLLERELMRPGSVTHTIWSYHDPNESFHVESVSVDARKRGSRRHERENPYPHRVSQSGIPFVFDRRPKLPFDRWMKIWRQRMYPTDDRDPLVALDARGMLFVCQSIEEAEVLLEECRAVMEAHGAEVRDDGNNLHATNGERVDPRNPKSSPKFRAAKLRVRWNGRWFEFQFQAMEHFLTHKLALDEANHRIFRWRQFVGADADMTEETLTLAELRYPLGVYKTIGSWRSAGIRELMYTRLTQTLGWKLKQR